MIDETWPLKRIIYRFVTRFAYLLFHRLSREALHKHTPSYRPIRQWFKDTV